MFSEVGVTLALKTLDLMSKLQTKDPNIKVCISKFIEVCHA